ncbi:LamG-like jellyroll fold domain-containing protein [bacterium]
MLYRNNIYLIVLIQSFRLCAQLGDEAMETWEINNVSSIANYSTTVLGAPIVVETDQGNAVEFNGFDDGLIVDANPVAGAEAFTVEVIFKPYSSESASNIEQRFVHMQESDDRRLLIELRLTNDNQWFLDTFIKDGPSSKALYAEDFPHPIGDWYHAALVYENGMMRHYIDGVEEMSGEVQYSPMQSGQTSVGVRLNQRSWYKGAIRLLRVTHRALTPQEFLNGSTQVNQFSSDQKDFRLLQNYPNPFNHSTVVYYQLSDPCRVRMEVLDILGREIDILVNGIQPAGSHHVNWDASGVASGLYMIKMETDEFNGMIRALLLK